MPHKIDPYTFEVIEYDMEVVTKKTVTGGNAEKLYRYFEEYMEELKAYMGEQVEANLVSLEQSFDGAVSKFEYRERLDEAYKELASMCENANQEHGIAQGPESPMWKHIPGKKNPDRYRKGQPMSFTTTPSTDMDKQIAQAIGKAVRHAERISKRDHIMADRVERVNLFITSLRREFSYLDNHNGSLVSDLVSSMCRKELWYDAGVMNLKIDYFCGNKFTREQMQKWIDEANRQKNSTEAARYQIEGDLEELERGLTGCLTAVEDAKRINQESEPLVSQLCELFV